ncbi:hypothetical protein [Longimicrobium terrae]|uniref:Acetoin utilization deacetylase AcuC-like enzyme n=1 Tax=Longimicrobium terrae TaxID=1639882 RepID=A0A841H620_9BACT|nr:acetoin utilization deacetylase AcuC-like enzyme [Longimicrobium terrae]MBB6073527.1 acetoin utilization deacetylase AcuC-like enzyme [Longimicrobium terrae]NNC32224.1 hypothetical protein [Longimicrobium terrae]
MKITAFVSNEDCSLHDTGWNHPDHQGRLPAIVRAVQRDMVALWDPVLQLEGTPATENDLLLVHTPAYLERLRRTSDEARAQGRTLELDGVPVSGASWDAATAAAGCALTAVHAVLQGEVRNAFALTRPLGRGAGADAAGEFSLINHVAIAARHLRGLYGIERVLVVAWGARPPVALARLLAEEDGIQLLSIHAHPRSFPHPDPAADDHPLIGGAALAPGSDGDAFAAALRAALADADKPVDFVLLAAGFDILAADAQGPLAVQADDIHAITTVVREWADQHAAGRLVSTLEGGYAAPETARAVIQHIHALAAIDPA